MKSYTARRLHADSLTFGSRSSLPQTIAQLFAALGFVLMFVIVAALAFFGVNGAP